MNARLQPPDAPPPSNGRWLLPLLLHFLLHPLVAKAIHREFTEAELVRTFGVSRHEHVPDYHLLDAFSREHTASGTLRRIRFRAWNSTFLLELRPNRRLLSPHLISIVREGNSSRSQRGLPRHSSSTATNFCHFHGRLLSHGGHRAAVSLCRHRLMGLIVHPGHFLVLQTVPERIRRKLQAKEKPHYLVYKRLPALLNPLEHWAVPMPPKAGAAFEPIKSRWKRSLEEPEEGNDDDAKRGGGDGQKEEEAFCDVLGEFQTDAAATFLPSPSLFQSLVPFDDALGHPMMENGTLAILPPALANYTIPSAAKLDSLFIFPQLDPITLEIGLFLDSQLFEHFKREFTAEPEQHLTDFSLALINNVHVLYQQPSLSPNLDIVIVRFELWKTQPVPLATELHKNGQAQTLLDSFCRHQARINPGTDLTDPAHWDHAVLLTGYDIYHTTSSVAGVAPVGRMCDELFACSLVEGLHLGRSFVLAHEMGHNMGMVHDGVQNQCGRSCCLMSAVNGAGKTTWSDCSVREFNAFLLQLDESGRGNCLRDPSESIVSHDHLRDGRLPGQRFTADQQCSYFWGRDFQVEIPNGRSYEDICRILWCGNSGSTISTAHPALEGSWCGGEKWCHQGQCESWRADMGPFPTLIDGRWSEWSSAEKQCPVTQCQITGSIALVSQLRTCTAPAPNNGGRVCEGANVRAIVCGGARSLCEGFTRQEYGDRLCSAILHDQIRPDRQLAGGSFLHSTHPCKIWCHVRDSEMIRNKGQFPNGSPCGPGQYCVGGVCLNMNCDGRAIVQSADDCPSEEFLQQLSSGSSLRPVDRKREMAKWGEWGAWAECSANCGDHGVQKRTRKCRAPVDTECVGKPSEVRPCEPALPSCDKIYSDWNDWSECDGECGRNGTKRRERRCLAAHCTEPLVEEGECRKVGCARWEEWGPWSGECGECMEEEEEGKKKMRRREKRRRERKCTVAGAERDAELGCAGDAIELEECGAANSTAADCSKASQEEQTATAVADGIWGKWQPCSVSCGIGFQFRERFCGGEGRPCGKQARTCNVQDCSRILDAPAWSEWSLWSACSRSCGQGHQQRFRRCLNALCPGDEPKREQKRCVLGPCPQWTIWSPWTKCASCSVFETRKRQRQCVVRVGGRNGANGADETTTTELGHEACTGAPIEFDTCERSCLVVVDDQANKNNNGTIGRVDGVMPTPTITTTTTAGDEHQQQTSGVPKWAEWGEWSPCSVTCGQGMRQRVRTCQEGADCGGGVGMELEQCRTDVECPAGANAGGGAIAALQPEDRRWGEWGEWSECSVSCGTGGRQSRSRTCRAKLIFLCGDGYSREERECEPAPPSECPPDAGETPDGTAPNEKAQTAPAIAYPAWSEWSEWSACSCFSLTRYRRRFCRVLDPQLKGFCPGSIIDQAPCSPPTSPDDAQQQCAATAGEWSPWSDWSQCSQDCGQTGHRIRNRMCANPLPSNRGAYCVGFSFDQMPCDPPRAKCSGTPIDGRWSEWSEWSQCSNPCINGQRSRARYCSNPRPKNGGRQCTGSDFELQACSNPSLCGTFPSTNSSSSLPHWAQWSVWSECSPGCGFSLRRRHRFCEGATSDGGAAACQGVAQQSVECGGGEACSGKTLVHNGQWSSWGEWSGNCLWTGCIAMDPKADENDGEEEERAMAENLLEGSGEGEEDYGGGGDASTMGPALSPLLMAQALGTRSRTRSCLGPTPGGLPCFGPSSQHSACPNPPALLHRRKCVHSSASQLLAHIWTAEIALFRQILIL